MHTQRQTSSVMIMIRGVIRWVHFTMKKFVADVIFWLHVPIVLAVFAFFFIPLTVWPSRIAFHFWYIIAIIASQVLMGLYMKRHSKKFGLVCPMTTVTQSLRGYKITDPRNYDHGCIREFARRVGINLSAKAIGVLTMLVLLIIIIQYFMYS